jgi:hypothetical protein
MQSPRLGYSITSSARTSNPVGNSIPLRLAGITTIEAANVSPEGMATACRYRRLAGGMARAYRYQAGPKLSSLAARPAERFAYN